MSEPTIEDQITCVKREISLRNKLYPGWVEHGKLAHSEALKEIRTMKAVLGSLERLRPQLSEQRELNL